MASTGVFGRDMHSPGYQDAHCLPSAGLKPPLDRDVYRFNRVVPMFESDPCIRPNEGVLLCPPGCGQEKRNDLMPYAGVMPRGDVFRFYTARQTAPKPTPMGACRCPAFANDPPCTSMGPITDPLQCPCINRCKQQYTPSPLGPRDIYPTCLNPSVNDPEPCPKCRKNKQIRNLWGCPGSDPNIGPKMAMFLFCGDAIA